MNVNCTCVNCFVIYTIIKPLGCPPGKKPQQLLLKRKSRLWAQRMSPA